MQDINEQLEILKAGIGKRFDKDEEKILELFEKQNSFHDFFKQIQKTAELMNGVYDKMSSLVNKIEVHERDLIKIASELEKIKENGVPSNNNSGTGEIDYNRLVNKLVKASQDIIKNEIQFAFKNK